MLVIINAICNIFGILHFIVIIVYCAMVVSEALCYAPLMSYYSPLVLNLRFKQCLSTDVKLIISFFYLMMTYFQAITGQRNDELINTGDTLILVNFYLFKSHFNLLFYIGDYY